MNLDFNNLTKLHKEILKKIILWQPKVPFGFSCNALHTSFFYESYTEKEICDALDELEKLGFITKRKESLTYMYQLTRDQYVAIKKHFKWWLRFQILKKKAKNFAIWLWKHFIITIITSAITAYITVKITQLTYHTTTPQSHTNSTSQASVDQRDGKKREKGDRRVILDKNRSVTKKVTGE